MINLKPYRTGLKEKEIVERQVTEMLQKDVIREISRQYSYLVVLVRKKDGSPRFCIDFRLMNNETIKDVYPLPRIDATLDLLQDANYFSKIDLKNGYWHIPIREKNKHLTAFETHEGLY